MESWQFLSTDILPGWKQSALERLICFYSPPTDKSVRGRVRLTVQQAEAGSDGKLRRSREYDGTKGSARSRLKKGGWSNSRV